MNQWARVCARVCGPGEEGRNKTKEKGGRGTNESRKNCEAAAAYWKVNARVVHSTDLLGLISAIYLSVSILRLVSQFSMHRIVGSSVT